MTALGPWRHEVVGPAGVDPDRVGQVTDPDTALGEVVDEVEVSRTMRPRRSRVCTTITSPTSVAERPRKIKR